jgi:hypothetical protein
MRSTSGPITPPKWRHDPTLAKASQSATNNLAIPYQIFISSLPDNTIYVARYFIFLDVIFCQAQDILLLTKEANMNIHSIGSTGKAHFSIHATMRAQQRGIRGSEINLVFEFADIEIPVGSSCLRLSISKRELTNLINEVILTPAEAEKCQQLFIITDGHSVITTYRN